MKPITDIDDPALRQSAGAPAAHSHPRDARRPQREPGPALLQLDATLGTVAYHVRTLHSLGLVELVDTRQRRGATEHYYRAREHPRFPDDAWSRPGPGRQAAHAQRDAAADRPVRDRRRPPPGGFDRAEAHMTRALAAARRRAASQQLAAATRKWLREAERIEATAAERLDKSGDAGDDGAARQFDAGLVVMLFEGRPGAPTNADGAVARALRDVRRPRATGRTPSAVRRRTRGAAARGRCHPPAPCCARPRDWPSSSRPPPWRSPRAAAAMTAARPRRTDARGAAGDARDARARLHPQRGARADLRRGARGLRPPPRRPPAHPRARVVAELARAADVRAASTSGSSTSTTSRSPRQRGIDVVGVARARAEAARGPHRAARRRAARATSPGRTVGVSGLPSDPAFVRAIVQGDGGDYARVKQVTIGFQAVSSILSKRVDAVPAFWNAEGVALRERGVRTQRVPRRGLRRAAVPGGRARHGAEHAASASRRSSPASSPRSATASRSVLAHPEPAAREIAKAAGQADLGLVRAQLRALRPVVVPPMRLDRGVLERWAAFDARFGIVRTKPDVDRAFAFGVAR